MTIKMTEHVGRNFHINKVLINEFIFIDWMLCNITKIILYFLRIVFGKNPFIFFYQFQHQIYMYAY